MAALRSRRPAGAAVSDWPSRGDGTRPFPRRSPRCSELAPSRGPILGASRNKGGAVMALLEAQGVTKHFGGLAALQDVDLLVEEGEILGLIGPNGAGKTTLFNVITGILSPTRGSLVFGGTPLLETPRLGPGMHRRKPHEITKVGLGRTFPNIRLFPGMTALGDAM